MIKKTVYVLTTLLVLVGMLGFASPAYAANSHRKITNGRIVAVDKITKTMLVKPVTGKAVLLKTNKNTAIVRHGKIVAFNKLRVGDKTTLNFDTTTKLVDDMSADFGNYEIHGSIEAVDAVASKFTIASEEGLNSVVVKVDETTVIERNGVAATFADILLGDKVEAKYNSSTMIASSIKVESEDGELHGTVSAVDLVGNTVSITPELGGADVVLNISLSTVITREDLVVTLADLLVGDAVEAKYDSVSMIASFINSESEGGEVHGTISAVDTTAGTVSVTPELGGADVVVTVDLSTVVIRNDVPAELVDLQIGDRIEVHYDSATMIASLVDAE